MTRLKICGVTDPETAIAALKAGADYIGLIFHEQSRRHVSRSLARAIATAVHQHNGHVVPVFVDQDADAILLIAEFLAADMVQLHGLAAIQAYPEVSKHYPCIIAMSVDEGIRVNPMRDFLLYDNVLAGSGQTFNWSEQIIKPGFKSFIAGGIDEHNALEAIEYFKPYALDVSSGVEGENGAKDLMKIRRLCKLVKER